MVWLAQTAEQSNGSNPEAQGGYRLRPETLVAIGGVPAPPTGHQVIDRHRTERCRQIRHQPPANQPPPAWAAAFTAEVRNGDDDERQKVSKNKTGGYPIDRSAKCAESVCKLMGEINDRSAIHQVARANPAPDRTTAHSRGPAGHGNDTARVPLALGTTIDATP